MLNESQKISLTVLGKKKEGFRGEERGAWGGVRRGRVAVGRAF